MPARIQILILGLCIVAMVVAQPLPEPLTATPKSSYLLGTGDQLTVKVADADEVPDKPFRIDENGDFSLPMVGRIHAAGMTVSQLQSALTKAYAVYIREPQVVVAVAETRSQPVSVLGSVNSPGVHQLQGRKTLVEVLSDAGGLRIDCGYRIKVTRRSEWGAIPLPGSIVDAATGSSVAEVAVKGLLEAVSPSDNIEIKPNDVITVPSAEVVYVIGDVKKSGGFVLGQRPSISVIQALAMAEGLGPVAKPADARIMRLVPGASSRVEIPIDLKKIMTGKSEDVLLQQNDILFVPTSTMKRLGARSIDAMVGIGTGLAVYRP